MKADLISKDLFRLEKRLISQSRCNYSVPSSPSPMQHPKPQTSDWTTLLKLKLENTWRSYMDLRFVLYHVFYN